MRRAGPVTGALVALVAGLCAPAAHAGDDPARLRVGSVRVAEQGGYLVVDLAATDMLDKEGADLLARGVPATAIFTVELWKERSTWFDRLEASRLVVFRIQLDVWDQVYELWTLENGARQIGMFPSIETTLARVRQQHGVRIAAPGMLDPASEYYLVVSAALKPLTLEDVTELEGWLSGEIRSGKKRGFGILGLPRQLFGFLLNLTGLRDRQDTMRTRNFALGELSAGTTLERR